MRQLLNQILNDYPDWNFAIFSEDLDRYMRGPNGESFSAKEILNIFLYKSTNESIRNMFVYLIDKETNTPREDRLILCGRDLLDDYK